MKKILLTLTLVTGIVTSAQVKIGDNPTAIDGNSLLELETMNQGLLLPRVPLVSTTSYAPLSEVSPNAKQQGMTVYNTNTLNDVSPGLYVNDGFNWTRVTPKTLYSENSAISSARTVTLNNNDLTFTAGIGGTGKTIVASAFKTSGAVYGKSRLVIDASPALDLTITNSLAASDWTASDYIVLLTSVSGTAFSINLPDATLNDGRILFLINEAPNSTYLGTDNKFKPVNIISIPNGTRQQIISVGGLWHLINGN